MIERDSNGLPPELRDVTRLLRELPAGSHIWRQRLLHEIQAAPPPYVRASVSRETGRWSMRPAAAIAAGLMCAMLGGTTAALMLKRPASAPVQRVEGRVPPHTRSASGYQAESRVRFTLVAPNASQVSIVGDFNAWNPRALQLRRSSDGRTWEVEVPLAPGRYAYSFVVDGALARDPSAPQARDDDFGSVNSVVMVKGS